MKLYTLVSLVTAVAALPTEIKRADNFTVQQWIAAGAGDSRRGSLLPRTVERAEGSSPCRSRRARLSARNFPETEKTKARDDARALRNAAPLRP